MNMKWICGGASQTRSKCQFQTPLSSSLGFEFGIGNRNRRRRMGMGMIVGDGANGRVSMRDRSNNRKPLQKGRHLSIEAIQTVQALKRATPKKDNNNSDLDLEQQQQVLNSKFRRLLKLDMIAVLRELLRQNQSLLALTVFEDIRKEYWYKPQVSLFAEIIPVLGRNGFFDKVELLFNMLKAENGIEAKTEDFNAMLESFTSFEISGVAMECFYLMKSLGCEPDRSTFRILISKLESNGETSISASLRQEALKYYGEFLDFLEEKEGVAIY